QPSVSGEPTMSRGFEQMIGLAEQYGVKAEIFSNATLFTESMLDVLVPNLGAATISFDGATRDTFEFIRAGARYDVVRRNIKRLVERCRSELPADRQPEISINCTLMERNIRELPQLVRMAKEELGVDQVSCYHVFPVTAEMKQLSLAHHQELARACIDEAVRVAEQIGLRLVIESLDQLTAATAAAGTDRVLSVVDGVIEGLEARSVHPELARPIPVLDEAHPGSPEVQARRAEGCAELDLQPGYRPDPERGAASRPESIWHCDFLWNKTYIYVGGNVRPCCVHEVPALGNVREQSFDRIWNNENYRAMRQRMVVKDPVPACKGCMHIHEITDPQQIDGILQGKQLPERKSLPELPEALDPRRARRRRKGSPPLLQWNAVEGVPSYTVEFSLDGFGSILFSTDSERGGPAIRENRYQVPLWAWKDAPVEREIHYRVLARPVGGEPVEIYRSLIPAE
ncbi:MAG: SPASM domain-containing protein, partial [Planctomycetes bacterium]|nr:SPASM domain-containing protein [Planctomycetota bacterium]